MTPPVSQPDPWLRGPLPGIPALLQPVAHALLAAREEIDRVTSSLGPDELWARPGNAASIGFHIAHLTGSTDRLMTYARGEGLSDAQRADLARERGVNDTRPSLTDLLAAFHEVVRRGLDQLVSTDIATLSESRAVGRSANSTVVGLLFHSADHAAATLVRS